jgi:hypothetical protein
MRPKGTRLDERTLERLRTLSPEEVLRSVTDSVYAAGPAGSEDFLDVLEQLVEEGILTDEQVEAFGDPLRRA